ncbi:MAG: DNA-binding response regulator [Opitutae bacterium]|nr:DNA-binding response regulator [Opitutae bacterium]
MNNSFSVSKHSPLKGKEILLLEDDNFLSKRLVAQLERAEAEVTSCTCMEEAKEVLKSLSFDFALMDLNLPDGESIELLRVQAIPSNTIVILMTAEGGIKSAVEAMRLGATDYLSKPFDVEEIPLLFLKSEKQRKNQRLVQHSLEKRRKKTANLYFEGSFADDLEQLSKVTEVDQRLTNDLPPILIDGPTGSGKSTYARWIHDNGPRQDAPFVAINCSAIPDNLVESELFGHEKGAFTDAKNARIGLFEAADHGTLFLDEIASLSLEAQAKLLLALENKIIRRVGGTKEIKVDVRIIGAANQDLRKMITEGSFREDLFHRLDLLRIQIPPLTTRGKDIPGLSEHLILSLASKYNVIIPKISSKSKNFLVANPWTGNIRELIHELERGLILTEPGNALEIRTNHPIHSISNPDDWLNENFSFPESGFDLEKEMVRLIQMAIAQTNGNISEAARILGVPRDYIRYRLKKKNF